MGNDEDAGEDADEQAASDDAEPQPDGRSASAATPVSMRRARSIGTY